MSDEEAAYARAMNKEGRWSIRDLDIDAFADGILAHREGLAFHENPHGNAFVATIKRLSWHIGWNERALQVREPGR